MARAVRVQLGERAYDVRIGAGLGCGETLGAAAGARALLVTDTNVAPLHADAFEAALRGAGVEARRVTVPAGEASKTLEWAGRLYDAAAEARLDRASYVVALGGGMVGDLAGFVAGTYLRGVRFVQVPTTLLAMVDSAIGGKTAVNLAAGKNLVGVFHQPVEALAELATLATLPAREYVSGLAEVVKYGAIWDAALFRELEERAAALLARETGALEAVVARCCEIKAEIVAMDERESGVRAALNFGHTFGHALERVAGYGVRLHGEAVAVGMAYAARLSALARGFAADERDRLIRLLAQLGLPTQTGADERAAWPELRGAMSSDKKALRDRPRFVLVERLGGVTYGCEVEEPLLEAAFRETAAD